MLEALSYTLEQLIDKLEPELGERITARTIHYYTNIRLLEGPGARGGQARYSQDHFNRIILIKRLQQAHLPLDRIRAHLAGLSPAEIEEQLKEWPSLISTSQAGPSAPLRESAAEYVARVSEAQRQVKPKTFQQSLLVPPDEPDSWEHYTLGPGVELQVRVSDLAKNKTEVRKLLDYAQHLFGRQPR